MLSTHHFGKMVESNRQTKGGWKKKKPESIISYNNFMCGVDRMDQLMSTTKNAKMIPQSCVTAPRHGYGKCFHFEQKGWWYKGAVEILKECNCFAVEF